MIPIFNANKRLTLTLDVFKLHKIRNIFQKRIRLTLTLDVFK